jgi:hypothetical protein
MGNWGCLNRLRGVQTSSAEVIRGRVEPSLTVGYVAVLVVDWGSAAPRAWHSPHEDKHFAKTGGKVGERLSN